MTTLRLFAAAVIGLTPVAATRAADPDPDRGLQAAADRALAAVPDLHRLNLLVSVVGRMAVVGGPVPDAADGDRIAAVLRTVPGLLDVKVACWVPAGADPLVQKVGERLTRPAPPLPAPPPDHRPVGTVTARRIAPSPTGLRYLLDPVSASGAAARPDYPTIPAPAVPTAPADPTAAVAALRSKDRRFAGLSVALVNGTATVSGRATDPAAAWDLAALVRSVSGVRRVVVAVSE